MTAEELLKGDENHLAGDYTPTEVISAMIEFASYHVQKALEEVSKNAKLNEKTNDWQERWIDKDSILNSYPLTNIK